MKPRFHCDPQLPQVSCLPCHWQVQRHCRLGRQPCLLMQHSCCFLLPSRAADAQQLRLGAGRLWRQGRHAAWRESPTRWSPSLDSRPSWRRRRAVSCFGQPPLQSSCASAAAAAAAASGHPLLKAAQRCCRQHQMHDWCQRPRHWQGRPGLRCFAGAVRKQQSLRVWRQEEHGMLSASLAAHVRRNLPKCLPKWCGKLLLAPAQKD
jgi:hypothetical protein